MPPTPVTDEPAITAGVVQSTVAAVLTLLVAFGVPVSDEQRTAILGLFAVVAPVVVGLWVRSRVTPSA